MMKTGRIAGTSNHVKVKTISSRAMQMEGSTTREKSRKTKWSEAPGIRKDYDIV